MARRDRAVQGLRVGAVGLVAAVTLLGCSGETRFDVFIRASELEQTAWRGACQLFYDEAQGALVVSQAKIEACLTALRPAREEYARAAEMDPSDQGYAQSLGQLDARIAKLEGMAKQLQRMEAQQAIDRARTPGVAPR
jgi:hypothetical protein